MVIGQRVDAPVGAVQAHRLFPHAIDIEFLVGDDDVMDVDDDALVRPGRGAAAMHIDDVRQGASGCPGGHNIVVVCPGVVGDVDLDVGMPLHEAFVVLGLARAEGGLPVAAESQLDRVLGCGDIAQRTHARQSRACAAGRRQLQECAP